MAKEQPTLKTVERRVETLEVGMNAANELLSDLVNLKEQLQKTAELAVQVKQIQVDFEKLAKKVDALKSTPSTSRKTKTTDSDK